MSGFAVEVDELTHAADVINGAADVADGLALDKTSAGCGAAAGNDEVATALTEFGDAWNLAKGILQQRARAAAGGLDAAVVDYTSLDQNAKASLEGPSHA